MNEEMEINVLSYFEANLENFIQDCIRHSGLCFKSYSVTYPDLLRLFLLSDESNFSNWSTCNRKKYYKSNMKLMWNIPCNPQVHFSIKVWWQSYWIKNHWTSFLLSFLVMMHLLLNFWRKVYENCYNSIDACTILKTTRKVFVWLQIYWARSIWTFNEKFYNNS